MATKDTIRILTPEALEEEPDPEWLITDVLQRATLAAIVGNRNTYKTFMALDMGLCIATGLPWQGHPVRQGYVLHVVGEGGRGIKRREHAWLIAHQLEIDDLAQRWRCTVKAVDLMTRADELIDVIRSAFPNGQLDLLVIDTFARNSSGDENSTEQMKLFVVELDKIVEAFTGLCLLLVHHNNRAGAWRGNSAVDGALNTIFMMESRNDDEVVVHCDKQKDSEEIDDFLLRKRLVPLVETPDHPGMILQIDTHADPDGDTILEYLDKSSEKNTRSDEVGGTRDDVLKIVKAEHAYGDKKFNEIWKRLKESKQIVTADGKPEKPKGTRWVRNLALLDLTF